MMTTGQRIKAARERAGMTQAELAAKLGIPYQSVSQWERGTRNPKQETLKRIAAALGAQPWDLDGFYNVNKNIADLSEALLQVCGYTPEPKEFWTVELQPTTADELLSLFDQLNPDGQQKAVERVEELTEIPRYRADTPISESTPTADSPASED